MKKTLLALCFIATLFSPLYAARTNPRVGRNVWRMIRDATPTPIENKDDLLSTGVITIDTPGNYQLYENLDNKTISIEASGVCLDLNGYEITTDETGGAFIIKVDADALGANLDSIKIFNGSVRDTSAAGNTKIGVYLNAGSGYSVSKVLVEDISVTDGLMGVFLNGEIDNEVVDCELVSLDLVGSTVGLFLDYADENLVRDCCATYCTQYGFSINHGKSNCFHGCHALRVAGESIVVGFKTEDGMSNLFKECVVKEISTSAEDFCNKAIGFLLTGTEEKTKIVDCVVNEVDMTSTVSAVSYGIHLAPTIEGNDDLLDQIGEISEYDAAFQSVAWCPDSRYIAVGGENNDGGFVAAFGFDGQDLSLIDAPWGPFSLLEYMDQSVISVDWSPDGNFVVSGDLTGHVTTFRFDETSLKLTHSFLVEFDGDPDPAVSVAWSPDGHYVAVGAFNSLHVLDFDEHQLLSQVSSFTQFDVSPALFRSVAWSPDQRYIATTDAEAPEETNAGTISVFNFDGRNLSQLDKITPTLGLTDLAWSPNGMFIATCGVNTNPDTYLLVYFFDGTYLYQEFIGSRDALTLDWSPDGKYLGLGFRSASQGLQVDLFNGLDATLHKFVPLSSDIFSLRWSADGKYIATADFDAGEPDLAKVVVYKAMYGPEHCFVRGCSVCDTEAYGEFVGTGIMGAGTNGFFDNICCNNEVDFSFGIPNVFYGKHNDHQPFDNSATQRPNFLVRDSVVIP